MRKGLSQWRTLPTDVPTARLMDSLGRRWALRVIWELRAGPETFRGLQAACGHISPSVLQTRLHELAECRVVEKVPRLGYRLTTSGETLYQVLEPLADWSQDHRNDLHTSNNSLHKK